MIIAALVNGGQTIVCRSHGKSHQAMRFRPASIVFAPANLFFFSHFFHNKHPKPCFILPNVLYLGTGGDKNLNQKLPGSGEGGLPRENILSLRVSD
jgi:hypothetical protein